MALAGARERYAVEQLKKARRATWDPTVKTHLDTSTLDESFLKKAADLASRRSTAASSLSSSSTSAAGHDRPVTSRLAPTPEDRPSDAMDTRPDHALKIKRHSMYATDKRKSFASAGSLKNPMHMANVRRWDAKARTTERWDGLQNDPELYYPSGELLVHLHARGHSRRGPSFRVSLHRVHKMRCGPMFTLCFAGETEESRNRRMPGAPSIYDIFVPSPQGMMREDAFTWHLTTRNFFAFLYGKPLVAVHLGRALVDLYERMSMFRSEDVDNRRDLMLYLERTGYLNFGNRPDYALAILYYAEHFHIRELWVDAFAHCVGMSSIVTYSPEYQGIRRSTRSLINSTAAEMDMRLARGVRAMSNFLEEELSNSHLGLSAGARQHLDRFRSFMHQYYVEKFGYWPPHKHAKFQRVMYKSMYFDIRNLYEYLVDSTSSDALQSHGLASGGICVLQNVQAFDRRHQYHPLPHPLPLLPDTTALRKEQTNRRSFLSITLGSKSSRANLQNSIRTALHTASNSDDLDIVNAPLVKAYRQFERDCVSAQLDEKVSLQDARKVRWIMIYCALQTLISMTRAPEEVKDAERTEYPLCCNGICVPPWEGDADTISTPISPATTTLFPDFPRPATSGSHNLDMNGMPNADKTLSRSTSFEIHPDCETDMNYFGNVRSNSTQSLVSLSQLSETPTVVNTSSQHPPMLRRTSSIASQTSQRSRKTLSFSNIGSRRSSVVARPQSSYCEIIVHGYGNGLNETILGSASASSISQANAVQSSSALSDLAATDDDAGLMMKSKSRPRPVSAYLSSHGNSAPAILAPQPVRPLSAHERKSFKLPTDLTILNTHAASDETRAPTLEMSQVDGLNGTITNGTIRRTASQATSTNSSVRTTPVSASDGTESDHNVSPVWSSRRGSASSQSSADVSTVEPEKITVVEDTAGFIDSTPTVEFQDVGGLLQKSTNPARRGILVHRSFSVDRFKPSSSASTNTTPHVQAVRRVRDQALSAAQRTWRRRSVRNDGIAHGPAVENNTAARNLQA